MHTKYCNQTIQLFGRLDSTVKVELIVTLGTPANMTLLYSCERIYFTACAFADGELCGNFLMTYTSTIKFLALLSGASKITRKTPI